MNNCENEKVSLVVTLSDQDATYCVLEVATEFASDVRHILTAAYFEFKTKGKYSKGMTYFDFIKSHLEKAKIFVTFKMFEDVIINVEG